MGPSSWTATTCAWWARTRRRGTFGHRNAAYVDYRTGAEHVPLSEMADRQGGAAGRFFVFDSLLSEYAALGFEYGYSLFAPGALVAWEAQFGDFVNGAQVVIDQFLAASEVKWEQRSRLVLLLPHGYEGQGPEHSSARIERFLALCAEDNICVANVTTAAQLFHVLRRQVYRASSKPLILFTPKRYLRGREAYSLVEELSHGAFREVVDDRPAHPQQVRRVVFASGKVALDLLVARDEDRRDNVAIVRVEQLYPWPRQQIEAAISAYPSATEVVWRRRSPRIWGPGNLSATAWAISSTGDKAWCGWPVPPQVRPPPVATHCTTWSRPTFCSEP